MRKEKILEAWSRPNGIIFYSKICNWIRYSVTVGEQGKVTCQPILSTDLDDTKELSAKDQHKVFIFTILADIVLVLIGIILAFQKRQGGVLLPFLLFTTQSFTIFGTYYCIFANFNVMQYISVSKFHAAEHMTLNSYNNLNRIPSMKEVTKASMYSKHCTSSNKLAVAIFYPLFILIAFLIELNPENIKLVLMLPVFPMLMMANFYFNFFWFLQYFFLQEPSKHELEIALLGIEYYEEMENNLAKYEIKSISDAKTIITENTFDELMLMPKFTVVATKIQ